MLNISDTQKAKLIAIKIRPEFGNSQEGKLMFAVVNQAIIDFTSESKDMKKIDKDSARNYLLGNMPHAFLCSVDPSYIRRVIKKVGIELK